MLARLHDYLDIFGPSESAFSHLNTGIEGRFGILGPIRFPFRYSLADSVAVSVYSVRFCILTHRCENTESEREYRSDHRIGRDSRIPKRPPNRPANTESGFYFSVRIPNLTVQILPNSL